MTGLLWHGKARRMVRQLSPQWQVLKRFPQAHSVRCRVLSPAWRSSLSFVRCSRSNEKRATFQIWSGGERLDEGASFSAQKAWAVALRRQTI